MEASEGKVTDRSRAMVSYLALWCARVRYPAPCFCDVPGTWRPMEGEDKLPSLACILIVRSETPMRPQGVQRIRGVSCPGLMETLVSIYGGSPLRLEAQEPKSKKGPNKTQRPKGPKGPRRSEAQRPTCPSAQEPRGPDAQGHKSLRARELRVPVAQGPSGIHIF